MKFSMPFPRLSPNVLKSILTIIVLITDLLFTWSLLLSPQYKQFKAAPERKRDTDKELKNISAEIEEIDKLAKVVSDLPSGDRAKLDKSLPDGNGLEEFLATMHKLANQSGLLITNMYVKPQEANVNKKNEVSTSQLNMSLRGKYADFLSFLKLLENHARLVDVKTISITNSASFSADLATKVEVLNVNVSAAVYNLDNAPETPLFPYGRSLDLSLFEKPQFKALQVTSSPLPINLPSESNPFAPR